MFNIPELKEKLIQAYKKDPKPLAKFAQEIGITLPVLHNIMFGKRITRLENLAKIAKWLEKQ